MSPRSGGSSDGLSRRYSAALRKQLAPAPGATLRPAERLGRDAVAAGLYTLDLVRMHERALVTVLPPGPASRHSDRMMKRATRFFVAVLGPIENAHRTALEHNGRLSQLDVTVRRRTDELATARRQLQHEIRRRETVQAALTKSEHHYGQLLEKSHRMQEHLRRLSHEVLLAQEEERKKISRELHDEIGQTLTAINVRLAALKKEATVNTAGLKKKIASTQRLVERSMNTVHRFARELRPPLLDDLGLIPALHSYMKDFTKRTGVPVHFRAFAQVERLDSDKRTVLYRVAQEALMNVSKHAQAGLVGVHIQRLPGAVRMEIHDDGKSFQRPARARYEADQATGADRNAGAGRDGRRQLLHRVRAGRWHDRLRTDSVRERSPGIDERRSRVHEMKPITVLLADDHAVVREGLRALLESESDIEVVGEAPERSSSGAADQAAPADGGRHGHRHAAPQRPRSHPADPQGASRHEDPRPVGARR